MYGTKKHLVILSSLSLLLTGCGETIENGDTNKTTVPSNNNGSENTQQPDNSVQDSETCQTEYFNTTISPILSNCISCHSDTGIAKATRLVLKEPLSDHKSDNYSTLKTFITQTDDLIVQKGTNSVAHSGGEQLNSANKALMQTFVDYVKGNQTCVSITTDQNSNVSEAKIRLISNERALKSVALELTGSSPSTDEITQSSSNEAFDATLDSYMQSDAFYVWLRQNFNDFLLTDFYAGGRNAEDLLNRNDFPNRRWYDTLRNEEKITQSTRNTLMYHTNYAITKEPLELIVHVIKNERPFSEILTADYLLVNAYSARTYGLDENFTITDDDINKSAETLSDTFPRDTFYEAKIAGIPHAGLLTTITYLNKFPSTNTNLDRHRSAVTQRFFFDTDILALANRPINSKEVISDTATWTNPNCTVCHNVMEPIASSFKNWDNQGRYRPGFRGDATQPAGLTIENDAPSEVGNNLLQWLSKEMVKDDRFARASVKLFLKALLKREPLKSPQLDEIDYTQKLQAYNFENEIINDISEKFKASNMNAKVIIKEIIKSALYRAEESNEENVVLSQILGQANLITPEALNAKIYDTMGFYWSSHWRKNYSDNNNTRYQKLLSDSSFKILYGGINSGSVSKRVSELNGVMANVQMRMAVQMSCYPVSLDFYKEDKSSRKLFPYVSHTLEPDTEFAIAAIKKNIQYLHKHILNEDIDLESNELEATYKLFMDTYTEGNIRVQDKNESKNLLDECQVNYDPQTAEGLWQERPEERIVGDSKYIIRSWQAVITYLLSDFKFLYNSNAK